MSETGGFSCENKQSLQMQKQTHWMFRLWIQNSELHITMEYCSQKWMTYDLWMIEWPTQWNVHLPSFIVNCSNRWYTVILDKKKWSTTVRYNTQVMSKSVNFERAVNFSTNNKPNPSTSTKTHPLTHHILIHLSFRWSSINFKLYSLLEPQVASP
jgi:hypothetical protein